MFSSTFEMAMFLLLYGSIALGGFILWKLYGLAKTFINKKKETYDKDTFERLAHAFIQHKKETEQRLDHIEAVITKDSQDSFDSSIASQTYQQIEVEPPSRDKTTGKEEHDRINKNRVK